MKTLCADGSVPLGHARVGHCQALNRRPRWETSGAFVFELVEVARGATLSRNQRGLLPLHLDALTLFGLFAVTAMLVFYALEDRKPLYILCFAGSCGLGSIYGFLQGAWPFGFIEVIWAVVAARRWWSRKSCASQQ